MRSIIAILACVAVLALVNWSIFDKQHLLENGKVVYLQLAPVDPRSLMQGDYMALSFRVANDARSQVRRSQPGESDEFQSADGRIVVAVDQRSVATFRRVDDGQALLGANEIRLRYRLREGQLKFATNAFFFQEGTAARYEVARYGEFRVAPQGDLLLTGLRDEALQPL